MIHASARRPWLLVILLAVAPGIASVDGEPRPYRGKVFLGLGTRGVKLAKDERYKSTHGLLVTRVAAMSSADKVGVQIGDVIVSLDGKEWTSEKIRLSQSFGKAGSKSRPGDSARFQILRKDPAKPDGPKQFVELDVVLLPYPFTLPEAPRAPTNDVLRPDLKSVRPAYQDLCWELVKNYGYEVDTLDLLERIRRCQEYPDPHRLPIVRYVHRDPFKLEAVTHELADPILAKPRLGSADIQFLAFRMGAILLRFDAPSRERPMAHMPFDTLPHYEGEDLEAHLDYAEAVLKLAAEHQKKAFAALTDEEVQFILAHRGGMLDSFVEHHMLSYDRNRKRQAASVEVIRLAKKVDVAWLLAQTRVAGFLVWPGFTDSLRKAAEASGKNLGAAVVAQRSTALGPILIAGRGRTRYQNKDYAAIYELGGDDVYANNAASSVPGSVPTAVIVDYAGDDAYESTDPYRQGCGDMGVGILVDMKGNDNYIGLRYTQGVGFMGVGILCDEAGDDTYRGIDYHQGVGHWGAGILVDRSGRDRYEGHDVSQGVGLPGGCGLLYDAGPEGDEYYCKGKVPTGYGTPGVFEGWGQGLGTGYRPYASGGVGILLDRAGPDRVEGGNFSQGGGYFYGYGIVYNAGDDPDVYIGSRYAQGFCAHQAAGVFIEAGGDDRYMTRNAVAQGLSWDETSVLFIDEAGDDLYEGGGFSQGASAMNGFVIFLDRSGADTYLYTDQARAGGNSYHGGKSLSFFVDLGGRDDAYPSKPNNAAVSGGVNSVFIDLPASVADALKNESWRKLVGK